MNPIKKLLSVLLTVCMTLFLLPMAALAVEEPNNYLVTDENNVDRGTYSTLANAVAHANSGWTILVINSSGSSSIDETTPVTIKNGKTLTLNLCEQTLSLSSDSGTPLTVSSGGRLTVTNNGTFNVTTTDSEPALVVNGGTLTLDTSFAANPEIHDDFRLSLFCRCRDLLWNTRLLLYGNCNLLCRQRQWARFPSLYHKRHESHQLIYIYIFSIKSLRKASRFPEAFYDQFRHIICGSILFLGRYKPSSLLDTLSKILGHADSDVASNIYIQSEIGKLHQEMARLDSHEE